MNPLTNMKNVLKLSEQELRNGTKSSWHDQYKDSAWIFVGGLPLDLSEGDIICLFSQYGEIVNINLVRDKVSGKQKGFCFICYEDQRSTILVVDNFNGIKILGRTLRVDHVSNYRPPKDNEKMDAETRFLHLEGCAPKPQLPVSSIKSESKDGFLLPSRLPISHNVKDEENVQESRHKVKKEKKSKKEKKQKKSKKSKKSKRKHRSDSSSSDDNSPDNKKSKR